LQSKTILLLVIAFCISFGVAYFQYFFKVDSKKKYIAFLFILRGLATFLLLLLLINPEINQRILENEKPILSVLIDDSKSIKNFKDDKSILNFVEELKEHKELNNRFELKSYSFGEELITNDSATFIQFNTNIYKAVSGLNELYKNKIAPVVLLSDGNQTIGKDYEYFSSKQKIFPVVFGDTIAYNDVEISQLNSNKYSYLNNTFPVEILLNYSGKEKVSSKLIIKKNNKIVFTKKVSFSAEKSSPTITANLTSENVGNHFYTASIQQINNEKNIKNNSKNFAVEVIDNQTKVLVVYENLHPDLGALKKAVESNKQRKITYCQIDNFKNQINDYQLVVLFNVNNKFKSFFDEIRKEKKNYFLISGVKTDWNFVNKQDLGFQKRAVYETEFYTPIYNSAYGIFLQPDLGFSNFPPLKDYYGRVTFSSNVEALLFQQINGIETNQPLLFTVENDNQRAGVLLGEGIWKWRANSFLNSNSFSDFDSFIGNLIQYLASNKKRERLEVSIENFYLANETINVSAFYTDQNYKFDDRAAIEIQLTNTISKEYFVVPFSLLTNSYQVALENLPSGNYNYKVLVDNTTISKSGTFKITDFEIEAQFTSANTNKLGKLAINSKGKIFYKDQISSLIEQLLADKSFYTIQKEKVIKRSLINWQWLLVLIVTLFAAEWFVRKYYGKI
jgi:hypothetical protein